MDHVWSTGRDDQEIGIVISVENRLLREARRQPMLSRDEERELARRARSGDREAVHRLVGSHLRFVIKIARRYRGSGLGMADLVQEGCVGLMQALHRFNPDNDARLATYAMWWIKAAIQDHVMRSWSLVRIGTTAAQKSLFFNFRRLRARLNEGTETISDAAVQTIARTLNVSERDVRAIAQRFDNPDRYFEDLSRNDLGDSPVDQLPDDDPTPEDRLLICDDRRFNLGLMVVALTELTQRELLIIRRRYLSEVSMTLESIGTELGVSKERVRQIEAGAISKMRAFMLARLDGQGVI